MSEGRRGYECTGVIFEKLVIVRHPHGFAVDRADRQMNEATISTIPFMADEREIGAGK